MKLNHGLLLVALTTLVAWPAMSAATATDTPVAHAAPARCTTPDDISAWCSTARNTPTSAGTCGPRSGTAGPLD
jgi:hypothetical protein